MKQYDGVPLDGIGFPLVDNISSSKRPPRSVIVHSSRLQFSKLSEKFLNICLRNSKIKVRNHQFSRTTSGEAEGTRPPLILKSIMLPRGIHISTNRSGP